MFIHLKPSHAAEFATAFVEQKLVSAAFDALVSIKQPGAGLLCNCFRLSPSECSFCLRWLL
jgi:hypothetical protein